MQSESELELELAAATAEHSQLLLGLFERTNTPCHCQYWHFAGDKNAWLDRLFHAPEQNQTAFVESLKTANTELRGVVALHSGQAIGWLKLSAAEQMGKLYEQRLYRGLPAFSGPRDRVLTVGCLLVDEAFRRRGVARALLSHAVALAEAAGARCIEAFPRRSDQASPAELWTGPFNIFVQAGFEIVNDFAPYPVLRYSVTKNAPFAEREPRPSGFRDGDSGTKDRPVGGRNLMSASSNVAAWLLRIRRPML